MTWAPPGKTANSGRWRFDLAKGIVPPGHSTDPAGTQYELPPGYSPGGRPSGFHVVESPPGTSAPIDAINYTPETKEISDVGVLAPVDKKNLSLIPSSGLQRLAESRRAQRSSAQGVGAGADMPAGLFPGTPPLSQGPFSGAPVRGSSPQAMPNSGTLPTSAPPGAPYGRTPLGIGAGAEEGGGGGGRAPDPTDPLAAAYTPPPPVSSGAVDPRTGGVDAGGAPAVEGPGVSPTAVPADFTGQKQIDANTTIEYENGQEIGRWLRKPGATDVDPNAWSFHASAKPASGGRHVTNQETRSDGSTLLHWSDGGQSVVAAPKSAASSKQATSYGTPYVDSQGSLVQQGSNGAIRVIQRAASNRPTAATEQWSDPYQQPDGSWVQKNLTTGSLKAAPTNKLTAANEQWGPLVTKPDGSTWQQNTSTQQWVVKQPPNTNLTTPFSVGNRLVQFVPDPAGGQGKYVEVYRAPTNMQLQSLSDGTILGINPETGDVKNLATDPNMQADERFKRAQAQMAAATSAMNLIPQVSDVGGNLIVPEGAQADVTYSDPTTGQTSHVTYGQRAPVQDVLSHAGLGDVMAPPAPAPMAAPSAASPLLDPAQGAAAPPTAAPAPVPPSPFEQSGIPEGMNRQAPTPSPFAQSDIPEGTNRQPVMDSPVPDDMGAGAERSKSDFNLQSDLATDIPMWARPGTRRWKGLGSKFMGRGLDSFSPFVGVGQDGAGSVPTGAVPGLPAGPGEVRPPGPAGGPGGQWDPEKLKQLLPILLALLSGSGGAGGPPQPGPAATPAPPPGPMPGGGAPPPAMPGGMPGGDMGGMGMGADQSSGQWRPPIDPQHVLGTGHVFGQKMGVGDPVHHGVDLQAPKGTPVKAPVDGVVQVRHNPQGLGNEVAVVSPDGKEHRLGHLNTVSVQQGQQVKAGQPVGTVGDSGLTTGANLHYDERKGGRHFDPSKKMGVLASMPPAPGTQMMTATQQGEGGVGAGAEGGVGAGQGTQVAQDPATKAQQALDAQKQRQDNQNAQAKLAQDKHAEDNRHAETMQQLQQAAQQEADWKAVQDAVNAENLRHNQVSEQIQQQGQQLQAQEANLSSATQGALQTQGEEFQAGQAASQNAMAILNSALSNPWLQALSGTGFTPGGGEAAGSNPLMSLLDSILGTGQVTPSVTIPQIPLQGQGQSSGGGGTGFFVGSDHRIHTGSPQGTGQAGWGSAQGTMADPSWAVGAQSSDPNAFTKAQAPQASAQSGVTFGNSAPNSLSAAGMPGSQQLPNMSLDQWNSLSTPQKAALRTQITAMGPGAWQQFQSNFQSRFGNQAPNMTQLQSAIQSPVDQVGTQMSADMFGEGPQTFQNRQQKQWNASSGSNVMQSLLAGTGWG